MEPAAEPSDRWAPPPAARAPLPSDDDGQPAGSRPTPEPLAKISPTRAVNKVAKAAKAPTKKAAARKVAPVRAAPSKADRGAPADPGVPAPARARVRKARRQRLWVEPLGNDAPASHPVKAKLSSLLYHLPGMAFYDRTRPDRCYVDAEAAEADGFIRAKR